MVLTEEEIRSLAAVSAQSTVQSLMPMMARLIAEMKNNDDKKGRIDHRSIGGPPDWDSTKEDSFQEWQIKVQAWSTRTDVRSRG